VAIEYRLTWSASTNISFYGATDWTSAPDVEKLVRQFAFLRFDYVGRDGREHDYIVDVVRLHEYRGRTQLRALVVKRDGVRDPRPSAERYRAFVVDKIRRPRGARP
jgi:predicted DNA-binding transcriptional regulator YafY